MTPSQRAPDDAASLARRRQRERTIFINYRREDSAGQARALLYALERPFPDQVFMDVKGLEPGVNYMEEIERTVGSCRAVLVLVGRSWAEVKDSSGRRRIEDPRDVVALEITTALRRPEVLVIPVLVGGATLPAEDALPEALRELLRRQCLQLTDQDWDYNVSVLVETLRRKLSGRAPGLMGLSRRALYACAALVLALFAAASLLFVRSRQSAPARAPATALPASASLPPTGDGPAPAVAPRPPPTSVSAAPPASAPAAPAVAAPEQSAGPGRGDARGASAAPVRRANGAAPAAAEQGARAPAARGRAPNGARAPAEQRAVADARPTTPPPPAPSRALDPVAGAPPVPPPARRETYVSKELLAFQQFFGDPALKERGRRLVAPARWVVEPDGAMTFAPGEPITGFFPMRVRASRGADRVSFDGVRIAETRDGRAYVRISGELVPPLLTIDIEIGRATSADATDLEPTYRARARVRVAAE